MKFTNELGLPPALATFLAGDDYNRGPANISVTGLIDPPRKQALYEAHQDELTEDVSDRVYSAMGRVIHKMIEEAGGAEGHIAEKRYYMRVPGPYGEWTISGAMDNIDLVSLGDGTVRIEDWKTAKTDEMVYGVKPERVAQLNIYRVILEANGFKVGALRDYFLLRDHSKVRAGTPRVSLHSNPSPDDYPEKPVVVHDIEMWPLDYAIQYIAHRVALHQDAQHRYNAAVAYENTGVGTGTEFALMPQDALPECSDKDRWSKPPRFAATKPDAPKASRVMDTREEIEKWVAERTATIDYDIQPGPKATWKVFKTGSARASKTFSDRDEAAEWVRNQGDTYDITPRPGESIRCQFYCSVAAICEQWKALQQDA